MIPKRIILIRHGQSEGNADKGIYNHKPDWKLDLTDLGKEQALEAGKELREIISQEKSIQFYNSPFYRARQTFQEINKALDGLDYRIQVKEDPRIREQDWGHYRSLDLTTKIDEERDGYGTFFYRLPDGESCADVYDRVSCFLGTLYRDFEKENFPENVGIVTHGMLIRVFLMRFFHWTPEYFHNVRNPFNGSLTILERHKDKYFNRITPLRFRE